jgi:hypothetical protein
MSDALAARMIRPSSQLLTAETALALQAGALDGLRASCWRLTPLASPAP